MADQDRIALWDGKCSYISFIYRSVSRYYRRWRLSNIGAFCLRMRENRSVRLQMADLSEVMSFVMFFMKNMD
jgi:hypothetical protein